MDAVRVFELLKQSGSEVETSGGSGGGEAVFGINGLIKIGIGNHFFDVGRGGSFSDLMEKKIEFVAGKREA